MLINLMFVLAKGFIVWTKELKWWKFPSFRGVASQIYTRCLMAWRGVAAFIFA